MSITAKIETFAVSQRVTVATVGATFDAAGIAAILGALNTHYSGLSTSDKAAVAALVASPPAGAAPLTPSPLNAPSKWVLAGPALVDATVLAADLATVSSAISSALSGAGYTCSTVAYVNG